MGEKIEYYSRFYQNILQESYISNGLPKKRLELEAKILGGILVVLHPDMYYNYKTQFLSGYKPKKRVGRTWS